MKPAFQTMRPTNLHSPCVLFFLLLLRVHSSVRLPAELKEKMPRQHDTPRRGSTGRGGGQHKTNLGDREGYIMQVSMLVRCMIDEWESMEVSDHLASRRSGGRINHYGMMKNMLGFLWRT